ncbi:hypothetical protein ACFQ0H_25720 [Lysobacter gummosus]|uniref:hypothetical protein n=1 Tax=Lysobacter gummosus TaxID=262324 RepID=UPI0036431CD4
MGSTAKMRHSTLQRSALTCALLSALFAPWGRRRPPISPTRPIKRRLAPKPARPPPHASPPRSTRSP